MEFICPKCANILVRREKAYTCASGHSYDIAKSGYVNLLPPSGGGKRHGDDKLMVKARTEFLNKGYYDPLAEAVADAAVRFSGDSAAIIDAGCGEGKYACDVLDAFTRSGKTADIIGIDISKDALIQASRRSKALRLCAASTASMPVESSCADILLNIFSPLMAEEFSRVLRGGGHLIRAVPLEEHLLSLKELIYDTPYLNPAPDETLDGFELVEYRRLRYVFSLE
ncbi:MAG: methyltransferase domain-containing protein, partial [Oscillospiraceae bacterium]|nr:methyltransferase domain-containing protein [Oscillospiraceae bacterium]